MPPPPHEPAGQPDPPALSPTNTRVTWYNAVFQDGERLRTAGQFRSPAEADAYGRQRHCPEISYLGWAIYAGPDELDRVIGARQAAAVPAVDRRRGTVTRWDDGQSHGFITDDQQRSWFVSRDDLPAGMSTLRRSTLVSFAGRPHPKPGKRYPQAHSVRVEITA